MAKLNAIDINMNEEDWAKLTINLSNIIRQWSDGIGEDTAVGWWYDDLVFDMAKAAIGILKASAQGQKHYQDETN